MNRSILRWAILLLTPCRFLAAQTTSPAPKASADQTIEREFVSGGHVNLKFSAGEYIIRPSESGNRVTVRWKTEKPDRKRKAVVSVDVTGSECSIDALNLDKSSHTEIELPARAALSIRLKAGDLDISGIEGDKMIDCRTGDVVIDVGRADDYGSVEASVRVGDVEARPMGISKGGFARKIKWQGPGKHTLRAHIGIGSLSLLGSPAGKK